MEQELLHWVSEREKIRKLKESGAPRPWTKDHILQTYRFCNVRRKDDKVSQWLINNVYNKGWETPDWQDFVMFAALCRHINWPPTIQEILEAGAYKPGIFLPGLAIKVIEARKARGEKAYTSAYIIKGSGETGVAKSEYVVNFLCYSGISQCIDDLAFAISSKSKRRVIETFDSIHNWGGFMAGQVADDLTWCSLLKDATDIYDWAPIGPGSTRGFNRMMGRNLGSTIKDKEWSDALKYWKALIVVELGDEFMDMTAHDIQNVLCEFDKYIRVKEGGRMKSIYMPKLKDQW